MKVANNLTELVGNTPLVRLNKINPYNAEIIVKLEMFNPLSSVKDRVALAMVEDAEKSGKIKPGDVLVEPTSGNTGIGLAYTCAVKGYRLILTMPETMSIERRKILKALGAEIVLTEPYDGMEGAVSKAKEIAESIPNSFIPQQFENPSNPKIHRETTAKEILNDLDGNVDIFVAGVGTGGTLTGIGEVLKEHNPDTKIVAVEPFKSAVLSGGIAQPHRIQGIGAGFVPKILNTSVIDEILTVTDEDASDIAHKLSKNEGLLVGISSAAAVWAALELAKRPENEGKRIVTLLPDSGERYLSTWLYEEFAVNNKENKKLNDEIIRKLDKDLPPAVALSHEYFKNGLYCSEAILRAFNEVYNLGFPAEFYKISTGFGAGLGESGCSCGSVTGAAMVISIITGRNVNYESERLNFSLVNELHDRFRNKNKAICCRALTKNVVWGAAEHHMLCEEYVIDAASITDEIIKRDLKEFLPDLDKKFIKEHSEEQ